MRAADLNARGRAYLHVNCAHCHRFNGGGSAHIYLQHDLPLKDIKAVGLRPTQGTFGIHDAQILAPGDPFRSVLYFRLAKAGPGHMPHLGSKIVDERGLALLHDWIRALPKNVDEAGKIERLIQLDEPTALAREQDEAHARARRSGEAQGQQQGREQPTEDDYREAQKQADQQAAGRVKQRADRAAAADWRAAGLAHASDVAGRGRPPRAAAGRRAGRSRWTRPCSHAELAIRDLFEPFVPEEQRSQRLGEVDPPRGDPEPGRRAGSAAGSCSTNRNRCNAATATASTARGSTWART